MDKAKPPEKPRRARPRLSSLRERQKGQNLAREASPAPSAASAEPEMRESETEETQMTQGGAKPFAVLLGFLIKNDRSEVLRLAREIGVSDNTIYRWMNGTSEPRQSHL